ncbi:MAG: hypothetical protein KC586_13065, partial [Myxococcales bacterium]|nr:hypothetical protein [Myxococcales bacterium]
MSAEGLELVYLSAMMRAGVLVLLLVGCGSSEPAAPTPPAVVEAPVVDVPAVEPAPDLCAPFVARARHVAAADSGCSRDDQCTCRSGLLFA